MNATLIEKLKRLTTRLTKILVFFSWKSQSCLEIKSKCGSAGRFEIEIAVLKLNQFLLLFYVRQKKYLTSLPPLKLEQNLINNSKHSQNVFCCLCQFHINFESIFVLLCLFLQVRMTKIYRHFLKTRTRLVPKVIPDKSPFLCVQKAYVSNTWTCFFFKMHESLVSFDALNHLPPFHPYLWSLHVNKLELLLSMTQGYDVMRRWK